jgi:hypothetical protein
MVVLIPMMVLLIKDKCPMYLDCSLMDVRWIHKDGITDDKDKCVTVPGIANMKAVQFRIRMKMRSMMKMIMSNRGGLRYNGCPIQIQIAMV